MLVDKSVDNYLIISEIVYAELAARLGSAETLDEFLATTEILFEPSSPEALILAGQAWPASKSTSVDTDSSSIEFLVRKSSMVWGLGNSDASSA